MARAAKSSTPTCPPGSATTTATAATATAALQTAEHSPPPHTHECADFGRGGRCKAGTPQQAPVMRQECTHRFRRPREHLHCVEVGAGPVRLCIGCSSVCRICNQGIVLSRVQIQPPVWRSQPDRCAATASVVDEAEIEVNVYAVQRARLACACAAGTLSQRPRGEALHGTRTVSCGTGERCCKMQSLVHADNAAHVSLMMCRLLVAAPHYSHLHPEVY